MRCNSFGSGAVLLRKREVDLLLTEVFAGNPEQAEKNKKHQQDQLQKQKDGKGHWEPELASDSEEAVR